MPMDYGIEDYRTEFKENINDKLEKEIIGFLNAEGGNLYLGVNNVGQTVGIEGDIDEIQLQIKDKIKNNILPSTLGLYDIKVINDNGKNVININVASGNQTPYYLRSKGMIPSGVFIRIGSSTESMTEEQIEKLYTRRTRMSLKSIISPKQDLTFSQLKIYYEEAGYTINDNFLNNLDLYVDDKYNYLAYLLADNNNITIKVATYSGSDAYDLIENEEYGFCCLVKSVNKVLDKFDMVNQTFTKITKAERKELKKFDSIAIREAIINAFVHNQWDAENPPKFEIFSDHISITSTGVPFGITQDEFLKGYSRPRYPELMRVFKDLDLVEQLGTGITRILKVYDKDVYEFSTNFIRVNFKFNTYKQLNIPENLDDNSKKVFDLIKENNHITIGEMCDKLNIAPTTMDRIISKLKKNNFITREGSNKNGYWKVNID